MAIIPVHRIFHLFLEFFCTQLNRKNEKRPVKPAFYEPLNSFDKLSAEGEGFEPPDLLQSTVFKTAAIDRSAIPPGAKV